jgi:hypothetical protein
MCAYLIAGGYCLVTGCECDSSVEKCQEAKEAS